MTSLRDLVRSIAILGATVGGVAGVTFGLAAAIAPAGAVAEPSATPEPSFDLAVAPESVGGRLEVSGDRTGTMILERAVGGAARYEIDDEGAVSIQPEADGVLVGPEGRIRFERDTGQVSLIDYDGLSFYVDPGDCTVTHGARNEANGLVAARVECPAVADVRGNGVVSLAGVVAVPIDFVRGRSDLPPSGGRIDVAGTPLEFDEADIFLDQEPLDETGRIGWAIFSDERTSGIALEYDPATHRYFLTYIIGERLSEPSEPCPMETEELGRLDEFTTVVRLVIDCDEFAVPGGGFGSVSGTIVADVIHGITEHVPSDP